MSQLWRKIFSGNSYIPPAEQRLAALKPEKTENFPFVLEFKGVDLNAGVSVLITVPSNQPGTPKIG